MATTTEKPNPNSLPEDSPKKTLDLTQPPTATPDHDPCQDPINASSTQPSSLQPPPSTVTSTADASLKEGGESKAPVAEHDAPISDIQKKIRRAERFGISVQLSEQEKRNSRAERFGTGSPLQASETSKSEERKRKARAERFGMPSPTTAADEEAKKKARLARFAPVSKTDPLEEDKRKARTLRFSNPPSSSVPQVNGKGNIETKAAVAGKAGGGA